MTTNDQLGQAAPKILYFITDEISSIFLRGQLGFLRAHGFDVSVATRLRSPVPSASFDAGTAVFDLPFVREPQPVHDFAALFRTVRLLRRERPTIVHSSTPKAGLIGTVAARICGVPVRVYLVRGLRYETTSGRRRRLFIALERLAARSATHVLFNSQSMMERARLDRVVGPDVGEVLAGGSGNGIDLDRMRTTETRESARSKLGFGANDKVIGFVGRLTKDKGIADLIAVFTRLTHENESARLLLVGPEEKGDRLDADTRNAIERGPRIVWLKGTNAPADLFPAMDVLCFPSYREGLPNAPLEAQYSGIPVVAYAATGTVDAVDDGRTGVLVPVGDLDALYGGLNRLLHNAAEREDFGKAGRAWVTERFRQEVIWSELLERYRRWSGD